MRKRREEQRRKPFNKSTKFPVYGRLIDPSKFAHGCSTHSEYIRWISVLITTRKYFSNLISPRTGIDICTSEP
jgi:hypothetical protein